MPPGFNPKFNMAKLLIVVRKVDSEDLLLGFFHAWIEAFARRFDKVTVIGLGVGRHQLPANVKVLSLGEESGRNKVKYLFNFFRHIIQERYNYDAVFVHASPVYIILGAAFWRLLRKKISLWYAHGSANWILKLAEVCTDIIFTSTPEGCRLKSSKIRIVGQGIDTDLFRPTGQTDFSPLKIVTVGRISLSKDYETLVNAMEITKETHPEGKAEILGGTITARDRTYLDYLKRLIRKKGLEELIILAGSVPNRLLPAKLQAANIFVNMGHTGSLDKAILEAMSCGMPILTCNEAAIRALGVHAEQLMFPKRDALALAQKIKWLLELSADERQNLGKVLREIVLAKHNLSDLVAKIKQQLYSI